MPTKHRTPTPHQLRILQALAASPVPLKSSELGQRAGLFIGELHNACAWLKANHYIRCEIKRVKQKIGNTRSTQRLAFWSLASAGNGLASAVRRPVCEWIEE